jgi:two-component system sensor histidine kinase VicK
VSAPSTNSERTEVLYGVENAMSTLKQVMSRVNSRADVCGDSLAPSFSMGVEPIKKGYIDFKNRGVKIRFITEITKDNIPYCKELMKYVEELRHMDGVKGNMAVGETEYVATAVLQEAQPVTQTIYSNAKAILEQQRYFFENLWSTAISSKQKIKEIEDGIIIPIRTRLLENQDEIIREIKRKNKAANNLSICTEYGGVQMSYNYLFDSYKNVIERQRRNNGKERVEDSSSNSSSTCDGLRLLTSIDKAAVNLVKIFLDSGIKIRHLKNMPPMSFGVSDKEVALTIEKMEGGKMSQTFLISNEPLYVNQFNSLFEELWKNGIDAVDRIKDIEAGVDLADIEVIPNSTKAQTKYLDMVKSATEEILLVFPTTDALVRQEKIGAIELAKEAAKERNVKVRILMPANKLTEQSVGELKQDYLRHIDIRYIEQMSETKATILVVDRKSSLVMELRDDAETTFAEAIGLSTYSNSKAGVLSYVAIFDNWWKQTELYRRVIEANERLKVNDKMQKEFINVAAHELRTPIQPILGLTEILRSRIKDREQLELLDVTIRNARRLQRLTEDILDVTKIDGQSLRLKKERFNLHEMMLSILADCKDQLKDNKNIKLELAIVSKEDRDTVIVEVEADKARLNQVIMNLLSNAIKFTREGSITITTENKDGQLLVRIKDTGVGIDSEIFPRLFTKFATKSETGGTGLGLYISKSIVEAHGGKIWAENNSNGKGATFSFAFPAVTSKTRRIT